MRLKEEERHKSLPHRTSSYILTRFLLSNYRHKSMATRYGQCAATNLDYLEHTQ